MSQFDGSPENNKEGGSGIDKLKVILALKEEAEKLILTAVMPPEEKKRIKRQINGKILGISRSEAPSGKLLEGIEDFFNEIIISLKEKGGQIK